ncbi:unnamed protein product [Pleuronectes platessa]|uniref:Uncharacterized protein n=1 Tax=Pleuronectes platessa TaxID=8262 RepID=A0A9N7Z9X8_PLEPL|nr:unnamed protein product [Pleuronectes platessa]
MMQCSTPPRPPQPSSGTTSYVFGLGWRLEDSPFLESWHVEEHTERRFPLSHHHSFQRHRRSACIKQERRASGHRGPGNHRSQEDPGFTSANQHDRSLHMTAADDLSTMLRLDVQSPPSYSQSRPGRYTAGGRPRVNTCSIVLLPPELRTLQLNPNYSSGLPDLFVKLCLLQSRAGLEPDSDSEAISIPDGRSQTHWERTSAGCRTSSHGNVDQ